jgi:hypothetical protein
MNGRIISSAIAALIVVFLLMCTQDKLTRKIKRENTFEPKIENVQIIDTIYQSDINLAMSIDSLEMKVLEKQLNTLRKTIPKIKNLNKEKRNSFYKTLHNTEKQLDGVKDRLKHCEYLDISSNEMNINGYVIKLEFNGHLNESVINTEFKLLGPSFMFFDDKILDN